MNIENGVYLMIYRAIALMGFLFLCIGINLMPWEAGKALTHCNPHLVFMGMFVLVFGIYLIFEDDYEPQQIDDILRKLEKNGAK